MKNKSGYSGIERFIARGLSSFPVFKKYVKRLYAISMFAFNRKDSVTNFSGSLQGVREQIMESFFGYYDKSPVNKDSEYLLHHCSDNVTNNVPDKVDEINVCISNFGNGQLLLSFKTLAFNWQQGAKLQWIGQKECIFNDYDETSQSYVSHIVDVVVGKVVRTLPLPIYDCFSDKYALTLSFERLAVYSRDYGYFAKQVKEQDLLSDDDDGIFFLDLKSGNSKLLVSLKNIALFEPQLNMAAAKHTVNHIMISPDGERFMFIHRWFSSGRRYDRLVVCELASGKLTVLAANNMVSHCFWYGNDQVFGYLRGLEDKDSYWTIDIKTRQYARFEALDGYGDGHPHINGDWAITDTYPDKARMQHLIAVNLKTREKKSLGSFFHGFRYDGETRCDLHPRLSYDGQYVFFDTVYSGRRSLCWMEFKP